MEPGTKLGPYEITEQLGAGGMGEVYLAQDTRLGRKVAIKVLPAEFASDAARLARFEQEARAAAALNHPHIAVVHDIGTEGGTHFMVQEYLEGDTLREPLQKGALPLKKALGLATQIAEALAAAHAAGIIHRDLKPENIFVTRQGHAKVLDFGLAKLTEVAAAGSSGDATQSPTMMGTVAGQVMGTAGYMAPEQVEGSVEIDHRADLFAFGCVLYELVTAARAFAGSSLHDTLHRIGHEPARQLREIDPSLPVHLQRIVDKLLEKDPDDRYQHADDLAVDLRRLGRDIESGVLEREAPASPTEQRRSASGPRLALAVVALAAVALAAAWMLVPDQSASIPVLYADLSIPGLGLSRNMEGRPMSISADGRVIASHATVGGVELIAVLHLDTGETRLLEIGSPSINEPVVSPDGEWIAYVDQSVYRVSIATGAYEEISDLSVPGSPHRGLVWLDGERVLVVRGNEVLVVVVDTGEVRSVYAAPDGEVVAMPAALPSGSNALLARAESASSPSWELAVVDVESGTLTPLGVSGASPIYVPSGYVVFSLGGQAMAARFDAESVELVGDPFVLREPVAIDWTGSLQMRVSDSGTLIYWPVERFRSDRPVWVRLDGSEAPFEVEALAKLPALGDVRISPDGQRVVATSVFDIYAVDIPSRTVTPVEAGFSQSFYPVWLGETDRVLYSGGRDRTYEIYSRLVDSGEVEALAASSLNPLRTASWSRSDRRLVAREETSERGMDIVTIALDNPDERVPLLNTEHNEFTPTVSSNGRWMAYVTDETGRDEIWLTTYPTIGRRVQVSQDGGREPVWAPDSSRLYYWSGDRFLAASVDPEPLRVVEREFLFERTFVRYRWHAQYDVHPDGDRFLMITADLPNANVRIVQNWASTLEELARER